MGSVEIVLDIPNRKAITLPNLNPKSKTNPNRKAITLPNPSRNPITNPNRKAITLPNPYPNPKTNPNSKTITAHLDLLWNYGRYSLIHPFQKDSTKR